VDAWTRSARARPDLPAPQLDATLFDVHAASIRGRGGDCTRLRTSAMRHERLVPRAEDDRDTHADPFERQPSLEARVRKLRGGSLEHELRFVDPSELEQRLDLVGGPLDREIDVAQRLRLVPGERGLLEARAVVPAPQRAPRAEESGPDPTAVARRELRRARRVDEALLVPTREVVCPARERLHAPADHRARRLGELVVESREDLDRVLVGEVPLEAIDRRFEIDGHRRGSSVDVRCGNSASAH
jgi:hypothetical protein